MHHGTRQARTSSNVVVVVVVVVMVVPFGNGGFPNSGWAQVGGDKSGQMSDSDP